jgi:hypothetical protein
MVAISSPLSSGAPRFRSFAADGEARAAKAVAESRFLFVSVQYKFHSKARAVRTGRRNQREECLMADQDRIAALEATVANLGRRLQVREDEQAVRKLQHLYGYLIDQCLYREVVDLFTEDGEVRFFGGVFKGKAGAKRLYIDRFQANFTHGNNGPIDGFLLDHPQHQDIVDVLADGETALGRFRCTMQAGRHEDYGDAMTEGGNRIRQWWEGGLYENTYRKVEGVWRIHILNYAPQWHADYETGWAHTKPNYVPFFTRTAPEDPLGPDELIPDVWLWPTRKVLPFHNDHPVTGRPIRPERWQGDIDREEQEASI